MLRSAVLAKSSFRAYAGTLVWILAASLLGGCAVGPRVIAVGQRKTIDRQVTDYPTGFELQTCIENLNGPSGICWDDAGDIIIAESGIDGSPRIFGIRKDSTRFDIYPIGTRIPFFRPGFHIYGPIGGIIYHHGRVLVSHRDQDDLGVITSFGLDGSHKTIVAGLPTQGDYSVTDMAISPINGRLYFGVGATTNSGVVGLDNWESGWPRNHAAACDLPYRPIDLLGYRFDAKNPQATIFSPETMVTVPFQPFGQSYITEVPSAPMSRPTGAIYSVSPEGGDLRVEAWGVRNPAGLAISELGTVFFTDQGCELRGTRPVRDDPDALFRLLPGTWYGWPDFSRSLEPLSQSKYQPEEWMVIETGYTHVGFVIDHQASNLRPPDTRWISAEFKPLSGASKMDFVPDTGPFRENEGELVVALWGDKAPFATNDQPLRRPFPGYKIVLVDPATGTARDFVYNVSGGPASDSTLSSRGALERPIDVKFGPDGNLYILDFGQLRMKDGEEKVTDGTGKIFVVVPSPASQSAK